MTRLLSQIVREAKILIALKHGDGAALANSTATPDELTRVTAVLVRLSK